MIEKTFAFIKPDGVARNLIGECIGRFEKSGLAITTVRSGKIAKNQAKQLYSHLFGKVTDELFDAIVDYITSDIVVFLTIEGENAILKVREICGPTNPYEAPQGTIRGDLAQDNLNETAGKNIATRNIIHSSGSFEEAEREIALLLF